MSKTIHKVVLDDVGVQEISIPIGSEILCAREQMGVICVWFRCDPNATKELRKIAIVGTGHPAPEDGRYIGTASLCGGNLIFHIFVWPH